MILNIFITLLFFLIGGPMETTHIHWLGHASFRIEDAGKQIYIDPYRLPNELPKADYIFITHGHMDHFSPIDISKIKKNETVIVAIKEVISKISGKTMTIISGQNSTVDNLKVTTVPAYNINKRFHPRANNGVGYIITLSTGQRIYHAGDTDFTLEMSTVKTDIALLPCDSTFTMSVQQAAEAANAFRPSILIPMHWKGGVGSEEEVATFKKIFKGETVIKMKER
jgi:L-ascorbate metabolism protein UlaG (beta-lactamase superfamily)